jgi:cation:H+ antiporter
MRSASRRIGVHLTASPLHLDKEFRGGPVPSHGSPLHVATAISARIATGLAIVGLLYRPPGRLFKSLGTVDLVLFSVYRLHSPVLSIHGE